MDTLQDIVNKHGFGVSVIGRRDDNNLIPFTIIGEGENKYTFSVEYPHNCKGQVLRSSTLYAVKFAKSQEIKGIRNGN